MRQIVVIRCRGRQRDRSIHRKAAKAGSPQSRELELSGYQSNETRIQKGAYIYRRAKTNKKSLGHTSLDARQDLEAQCQEGRKGDIGEFLKASLSASLKLRI